MFPKCGAARESPGSPGEHVAGILQRMFGLGGPQRSHLQLCSDNTVPQRLALCAPSEPGPQRDTCVWGR